MSSALSFWLEVPLYMHMLKRFYSEDPFRVGIFYTCANSSEGVLIRAHLDCNHGTRGREWSLARRYVVGFRRP